MPKFTTLPGREFILPALPGDDQLNYTTPTKTPRYFAGSQTTAHDERGWVPEWSCSHNHRTLQAAEECAARHYPWTVYKQLNGRITRAVEGEK